MLGVNKCPERERVTAQSSEQGPVSERAERDGTKLSDSPDISQWAVSGDWWLLSSGPPLTPITPAKLSPALWLQPCLAGTDSTQWMFTNHRDNVRPLTPWHEPSWHQGTQTSGSCSPWGRPSPSPRTRASSRCSPGAPPWPADTSWVTSSVIWPELDIRRRRRLEMTGSELTARNRWWPHRHLNLAKDNGDLMRTIRGVGWSETPDKECKIRDKST